jgi:hypothetical protein
MKAWILLPFDLEDELDAFARRALDSAIARAG